MKTILAVLAIAGLAYILSPGFYSVKQSANKFALTREIEKNLALYSEPDTCLKAEPVYDSSYIKEKEDSNDSAMRDKVISIILNSYSKIKVLDYKGSLFGVFKDGTCGDYPELDIYLDCEDENPTTEQFGWTGSSSVLDNKNADLLFCIVSGNFQRSNKDYAVLLLGTLVEGYDCYERWITNEKDDNINKTIVDGVEITYPYYGNNVFSNKDNLYTVPTTSLEFHNLTILYFNFYPKTTDGSSTSFPDLSISYGVLGRFGTHQGYIFLHDEDKNFYWDPIICSHGNEGNVNKTYIYQWDPITLQHSERIDWASETVPNIFEGGPRTRLYISKAIDCDEPYYSSE
ncbi:MAG: hypothetical protein HY738_14130 [Bacteroidia bacterium]|nr:hypothetical protein [Bacteroidia bacterium]